MSAYIGLMSGTSADGIDAVLVNFEDRVDIIDTISVVYPLHLQKQIQALQYNKDSSYHEVATLDIQLGQLTADLAQQLIETHPELEVKAIGSHGQTIQHRPNQDSPYTLQIGSGAVISQSSGITTVNNFRASDIAQGGQAAPFAPLFHQAFFALPKRRQVIINIGGIANISCLDDMKAVLGYDTGPGNTLMDYVCRRYFKQNYDAGGAIARSGNCNEQLLNALMDDPYFKIKPPKSTGQEYFNESWLDNKLSTFADLSHSDLLTTLTHLTARSIAASIKANFPQAQDIYVCGGGGNNQTLLEQLEIELGRSVALTDELGIPAQWVEATGFAWLAKQAIEHKAANLSRITGSKTAVILGCIWPVS